MPFTLFSSCHYVTDSRVFESRCENKHVDCVELLIKTDILLPNVIWLLIGLFQLTDLTAVGIFLFIFYLLRRSFAKVQPGRRTIERLVTNQFSRHALAPPLITCFHLPPSLFHQSVVSCQILKPLLSSCRSTALHQLYSRIQTVNTKRSTFHNRSLSHSYPSVLIEL